MSECLNCGYPPQDHRESKCPPDYLSRYIPPCGVVEE